MRKIIAIGESSYDIIFSEGQPKIGFPGGRILNAAASLAKTGLTTTFMSECGTDYIGTQIIDFLEKNNVITTSIDRFTEGVTPCRVIHESGAVEYGAYPIDRFSVAWPRIDENDIIIFGSLYSVESAQREHLFEVIKYAAERKAIIIYIPGFHHSPNFRMTKVMTALLENLDVADIVLTNNIDIASIFSFETSAETYREKIAFYCRNYINVEANREVTLFQGSDTIHFKAEESTVHSDTRLGWRAGFIAGIAFGLIECGILKEDLNSSKQLDLKKVIDRGLQFAASANNPSNVIADELLLKLK